MKKTKPWVAQALEDLAKIHEQRGAVYGDDYLHSGEVMAGFFPEGLSIGPGDTESWNRLVLFMHLQTKLGRYARSIKTGGHVDSMDDLSVYGQLQQNADRLARERRAVASVGGAVGSSSRSPRKSLARIRRTTPRKVKGK